MSSLREMNLTSLPVVERCEFGELHPLVGERICRVAPSANMMPELYMARTCKWGVLRVMGGDLWDHNADVLVTPANNRLSGREGIDATVHAKAGKELTQVTRNICLEMRKINAPPCAVTNNVVTEPFALESNYKRVIHAVGPDCRRPNQDETRRELLTQTYTNLFQTIEDLGDVTSIVSPPISMGVFAYPHREGARLTLQVLLEMLNGEKDHGIKSYTIVVKERNFINNMRTVYREGEDQFPGMDTTMEESVR